MLVAVYEGRRLELHANRVLGNELDVLAVFGRTIPISPRRGPCREPQNSTCVR